MDDVVRAIDYSINVIVKLFNIFFKKRKSLKLFARNPTTLTLSISCH